VRAPVYRNVEAKNTIAGVSMTGFILLLGCAYPFIASLPPGSAILAMSVVYVLMRVAGHGRPAMFWQHFFVWKMRECIAGRRLSAAARASTPRFPFDQQLAGSH